LPDSLLYFQEQTTLLNRILEFISILPLLASLILLTRLYLKHSFNIYFWFLIAVLFAVFTNVYLGLWHTLYDVIFDAGHILKMFSFTSFLFGIFAEHLRFLQVESELRYSLEESKNELERREHSYLELIDKVGDGILVVDKGGMVTYCNESLANKLELTRKEVVGTHVSHLLGSNYFDQIAPLLQQDTRIQEGQFEKELVTASGKKIQARIHFVPYLNEHGDYNGFHAVISDVTEQKRLQKEFEDLLKEKTSNLELFKQSIERSTEGVIITDASGKIRYVNRAFEILTGFKQEELLGKSTSFLVFDKTSEPVHTNLWETVKDGKVWRGELFTRKKDGEGFIGEVSVIPINLDYGEVQSYVWMERDVTRKKSLEKNLKKYAEELSQKTGELEAAKSYYETLISGISDIILVVDMEGNCNFINEYGQKRLGYTAEELTKKHLPRFFDDLLSLEKGYGKSIQVEIKDYESPIVNKGGQTIFCSWNARPLFDSQNRRIGAMAVGHDITEYKKLQNALKDYAKNLEIKVKERTQALQQKVNQLAKILEISEEIRLNVDLDVILNKICESVQALGWNRVIISLRDYETRTSRPVAVAGLEPEKVEEVMQWQAIPFEHTEKYLREEFRISNSYFIDHKKHLIDPSTPYSVYANLGERQEDEWHSLDALLVPIRSKNKILGIISVDDPVDRKRPTLEKIRDLEIFAYKAALAIENVNLFQAQKEKEQQANLLADIGKIFHSSLDLQEVVKAIADKAGKAMGELCSLFLMDEVENYLKPCATYHENQEVIKLLDKGSNYFPTSAGKGFLGKILRDGEPIFWKDIAQDGHEKFKETPFHFLVKDYPITSLMALPLSLRGQIFGVMVFLSFNAKNLYKNSQFQLAQEIAERASVAIENARLFNEIEKKARELEQVSKLKSEFLTNVSHELRTPLNAIITLSDILVRGISGKLNEDQTKQMEIIHKSARNLLKLINDILDLSKIEAGKIEPLYSLIPIKPVIVETIEQIRPLCNEKGLELEYDFTPDVPDEIYSDQDKINRALINLLSNAVKFTPRGKITVNVALQAPKTLRIDVSDTGIGIPSDRLEEIFKEFHQVDHSDSKKYGGTGLGLSITKKIIDLLDGSVLVKSEVGKGSTFTLVIPFKDKEDIKTKDRSVEPEVTVVTQEETDFRLTLEDDRLKIDPDKKLILIIDDDMEANYILGQYLHEHNYQVIQCRIDDDVFDLCQKYQPFAIILDILMPEKSGWEILEELKHHPDTRHIPVVIVSILAEKERAYHMGASDYLIKPFEPEDLLNILVKLETQSRKRRVVLDLPKFLNFKKFSLRRVTQDLKTTNAHRTKILLVDDDKNTRYAIQYILKEAGYEIFFATNGREAIRKVAKINPDLILMDIMMPGMNGLETTKILKGREAYKQIPIIAVTAKSMKEDRERIILEGCDDYITKPFETETILNKIEYWLEKRQAENI
ncbi:MAG: PAS domain S-box protein, partial [Calditrichaeota bacterium]